jgi:hypothetical protein
MIPYPFSGFRLPASGIIPNLHIFVKKFEVMDLTKILSISGRPGLFKVISQGKNNVIVESLADQHRFPVFAHERMSTLEEISIYTTGEDRPLKEVLKSFFEKLEGKPAMDPKEDQKMLMQQFAEIIPDYDAERVYASDIRKVITWYNILLEHQMLEFEEEKAEEQAEEKAEEKAAEKGEDVTEEAKTGSTESTEVKEAAPEEKPKKRAPRKPKAKKE